MANLTVWKFNSAYGALAGSLADYGKELSRISGYFRLSLKLL